MSDNMTIVQFLRASGEHWDEDRYTAGADRIEALEAALLRIMAATPANTNSATPDRMASWTKAVAATALDEKASTI